MRECTKCGLVNEEYLEFCQRCGERLEKTYDENENDTKGIEPIDYNDSNSNPMVKVLRKQIVVAGVIIAIILVLIIWSNANKSYKSSFSSTDSIPFEQKSVPVAGNSGTSSQTSLITTWSKAAGETNGYDWANMTSSQKSDVIQGVLNSWKTDFIVTEGESWFADALTSFYGSPATNSTNVAQAMSTLGATASIIKRKTESSYSTSDYKSYDNYNNTSNTNQYNYDKPRVGESFSDYVKRVDPEFYNEMETNWNNNIR